jgi:hypothetical protein
VRLASIGVLLLSYLVSVFMVVVNVLLFVFSFLVRFLGLGAIAGLTFGHPSVRVMFMSIKIVKGLFDTTLFASLQDTSLLRRITVNIINITDINGQKILLGFVSVPHSGTPSVSSSAMLHITRTCLHDGVLSQSVRANPDST